MIRFDRSVAPLAAGLALAAACSCASGGHPGDDASDDDGDRGDGGDAGGRPREDAAGGALGCDGTTCLDPASGLTWEDPPAAPLLDWPAAVARCAALDLGGGGWRLPRIQELRSLIRGCPNTALGGACLATEPDCTVRACMAGCDQCPSTIVNGEHTCLWPAELHGACDIAYWSGTEYTDSIDPGAWYVGFGDGAFVHGMLQALPMRTRCVRGALDDG
jgi:hypothetical protein